MRNKAAIATLVGLTCIIALLPLYSQSKGGDSATVAAITKLENEGVKADLANDKSFIQNNTTPDFVAGLSLGVWEDKGSMLKAMGDPANNKTNSESISDLKVTSYGNVAIARYAETYDSIRNGKPLARTVLCTDTWVKQGGAWKEAASHCSQKGQE
jgi:hypothetical protein